MASHQTVFNHVGLCVADRERSRRFYEGLLGFKFWWELELPDQGTEQLLQLARPIGVRATYLGCATDSYWKSSTTPSGTSMPARSA